MLPMPTVSSARARRALRPLTLLATLVAVVSCADRPTPVQPLASPEPLAAARAASPGEAPARDHYLVRLRDEAPNASAEAHRLASAHGGQVGYVYERALRGFSVRLPAAAAEALGRDASVLSVRPATPMRLAGVQLTPPWGLDRIDQASLPLNGSYSYGGTGWNYTAYIFDTGVRTSHVDFEGRAITGFTVPDGLGGSDCNGHGTHVAGTVGGATYGVAKRAQIVSVKVFGYGVCSGDDADLLAGIDWVLTHAQLPAVANMSLGFGMVVPEVDAAINELIASGVAVVVAAGNSGADACLSTPSRIPNVVTVAASDNADRRSIWSSLQASDYGSCVDLFAPGTDVLSASYTSNSGSVLESGTSMASPHVAGAVAYTQAATAAGAVSQVLAAVTPNKITGAGTGSPTSLLNTTNLPVACPSTPCDGPAPDPRLDAVLIGGPYGGNEGASIGFGIASPLDPALTYSWDFGDDSPAVAGPTAIHRYRDDDSYVVRLTARYASDATKFIVKSATVTVLNVAPTAGAGNDTTIVAGASVIARGTFADPGAGDAIWSYTISWGDGSGSYASFAGAPGPLAGVTHKYVTAGTYTLRVTVTDKDGGVGTDAATVTVTPNAPPVANANGPYAANEGTLIQFSSLGSSDPEGGALTYSWSFGDGTTATLASPKKAYTDNGVYTVLLTVRDAGGTTTTTTAQAVVSNVAPTAAFTAPAAVTEGTAYNLSASGTDVGTSDRTTLQYSFDCGQGAGYTAFSTTKTLSCAAVPDQRALTTRAQVRDKDGAVTSYSKPLSVTNAAPVATFRATTPATALVPGTTVSFTGSFTDKGAGDSPWTYVIIWGDGTTSATGTSTPGAAITGSHAYSKPGTWYATLTVKDKDLAVGTSARVTVTVANDPPVAVANGPYAGAEGALIQFSSLGSNDPNAQTIAYTWRFGDGTSSTLANPRKAYPDNSTYTVTLIVKDASGATDTATTSATTTNVAPTSTFATPLSLTEGVGYTISMSGTDVGTGDRSTLQYSMTCGQASSVFTPWSATVKSTTCPALPDQGTTLNMQGKVRDKDGAERLYTKALTVVNKAPVVTFTTSTTLPLALNGTLAVTGSFTDPGASDGPFTYTIVWGDGTASLTGTGTPGSPISASHVYARAGTWYAYMSVKDKDGGIGTSLKKAVTVNP